MTNKNTLPAFFCIIILALACYAPSLRNGWHRDDVAIAQALSPQTSGQSFAQRYRNLSQRYGSSREAGYLRPLSVLSFMAEEKIWGLNPAGFHLTNLILHTVASVLVYTVAAFVSTNFIGFLSAAFFAVHPLQFETVGLIHNRNDIFCLIFLLLALRAYYAYRQRKNRWALIVSLAGYALALLSKEAAVLFPVFVVASDAFIFPQNTGDGFRQKAKTYFWYFLVLGAYFVMRKILLGEFVPPARMWGAYHFLSQEGFWWQLLIILRILGMYTGLLFGSFSIFDFCADYFLPPVQGVLDPEILLGATAVCAAAYLMVKLRRSLPAVIFGIVWFTVTYLPVSNIIFIGNMFSQHFMYMPSVGFFAVLSAGFERLSGKNRTCRRLSLLLAALFVLGWGTSTFIRNYYIKDDRALWLYTAQNPWASPRAHAVLGQYYIKDGKLDLAKDELEKTLEKNPAYSPAYMMLGYIYKQQRNFKQAEKCFLQVIPLAKQSGDSQIYSEAVAELKSLGIVAGAD